MGKAPWGNLRGVEVVERGHGLDKVHCSTIRINPLPHKSQIRNPTLNSHARITTAHSSSQVPRVTAEPAEGASRHTAETDSDILTRRYRY